MEWTIARTVRFKRERATKDAQSRSRGEWCWSFASNRRCGFIGGSKRREKTGRRKCGKSRICGLRTSAPRRRARGVGRRAAGVSLTALAPFPPRINPTNLTVSLLVERPAAAARSVEASRETAARRARAEAGLSGHRVHFGEERTAISVSVNRSLCMRLMCAATGRMDFAWAILADVWGGA
jgi:hypothetical protein